VPELLKKHRKIQGLIQRPDVSDAGVSKFKKHKGNCPEKKTKTSYDFVRLLSVYVQHCVLKKNVYLISHSHWGFSGPM